MKNKNPPSPSLPSFIDGIDRITLWLDRPELPLNAQRLACHCAAITISVEQMPFNARWKLKVEMHQPTLECLRQLAASLGLDIAVRLTYIEIARDVLAVDVRQARQLRNAWLAAARVPYQREPVVKHKSCWYFGRRTRQGQRRGHVLVGYADKPSKLNNTQPDPDAAPCFHMEWRASGGAALESLGLVTLADVLALNHDRFWDEWIQLHRLPRKTDLGRWLAVNEAASAQVSGTALRKRADRWMKRHSIKQHFVLQNALRAAPQLHKHLKKLTWLEWLAWACEPTS